MGTNFTIASLTWKTLFLTVLMGAGVSHAQGESLQQSLTDQTAMRLLQSLSENVQNQNGPSLLRELFVRQRPFASLSAQELEVLKREVRTLSDLTEAHSGGII